MSIKSRNKRQATFNLSSLTDIVFLLLIFFLLTSSIVNNEAIPVNYPQSESSSQNLQSVNVTVTNDLQYFVNKQRVSLQSMESKLRTALSNNQKPVVALHIDRKVKMEDFTEVYDICSRLKAKVVLMTETGR